MKRETIEEVVERLRGTCMESINADLYSISELREIDEQVFSCAHCGWWCETDEEEESEEGEKICTDCHQEELG